MPNARPCTADGKSCDEGLQRADADLAHEVLEDVTAQVRRGPGEAPQPVVVAQRPRLTYLEGVLHRIFQLAEILQAAVKHRLNVGLTPEGCLSPK